MVFFYTWVCWKLNCIISLNVYLVCMPLGAALKLTWLSNPIFGWLESRSRLSVRVLILPSQSIVGIELSFPYGYNFNPHTVRAPLDVQLKMLYYVYSICIYLSFNWGLQHCTFLFKLFYTRVFLIHSSLNLFLTFMAFFIFLRIANLFKTMYISFITHLI